MDAAEIAGSLAGGWAVDHPGRSRGLLKTAWSAVGLAARHNRGTTLEGAQDRMNGELARIMARSLAHPERCCVVNVFMPCEMLHAMGITPMFPEAMAVYVACTRCAPTFCQEAEKDGVPESFCSYHKLMLGMDATGVMPAAPFVANTTVACDANQLSFRLLSDASGSAHGVVDVPSQPSEEAVAYVAGQLEDLGKRLEETFGTPLDHDLLVERCERSLATLKLAREFMERRAEAVVPQTLTGELCLMVATHVMLGTPEAEAFVRDLVALLDDPEAVVPEDGARVPRLFWVHTLPNWQRSMVEYLDGAHHAELVGNDMAYDVLDIVDELDPRRPYEFMARRLVHTTSNGPASRRVDAVGRQARAAGADGVVLFGHWGCKQTLGLGPLLEKGLEVEGLPVLLLDGDGCDPRNVSDGAMATRLEAFVESLGARIS